MKHAKKDKIEKLLEKASVCEEKFRRFDPKRTRFSGAQRKNLLFAYNNMIRANKKLQKAEMAIEH